MCHNIIRPGRWRSVASFTVHRLQCLKRLASWKGDKKSTFVVKIYRIISIFMRSTVAAKLLCLNSGISWKSPLMFFVEICSSNGSRFLPYFPYRRKARVLLCTYKVKLNEKYDFLVLLCTEVYCRTGFEYTVLWIRLLISCIYVHVVYNRLFSAFARKYSSKIVKWIGILIRLDPNLFAGS
jgi:hypothetical protein